MKDEDRERLAKILDRTYDSADRLKEAHKADLELAFQQGYNSCLQDQIAERKSS